MRCRCSAWKSLFSGFSPSPSLTSLRCGSAFPGPAVWVPQESLGRSESGKKAHKASPRSSPSRFLVFLPFPPALPCMPAVFLFWGGGVSDSQAICQKLPQAGSILWPVPAQEGASLDGVRSKPLGLTHLPLTLNPASTLARPSPH